MFLLPDRTVVYSATDLALAAGCEFALLRELDVRLGRAEPLDLPVDATLERAATLGDRHEQRVLAELVDRYGPWDPATGRGVRQIERPDRAHGKDPEALREAHAQTLAALRAGADVVFQAGFFDGRFGGWADFLVRAADDVPRYDGGGGHDAGRGGGADDVRGVPSGPAYAVHDTKLARHAKVTALLQLAAYADQLLAAGVPVASEVHLVLGDRSRTSHRLADLLPVYRERRSRLEHLIDTHQAAEAAVAWDDGAVRACGRCEVCAPEVERRRDLLLVAGLRATQRARLHAVGMTTVEELARSTEDVPGMPAATLAKLRRQAELQAAQDAAGPDAEDVVDVHHPRAILDLPPPDPGDVFFDFEGDPLWAPPQTVGTTEVEWGLEYLFGLVEAPVGATAPVFRAFWAHDRAQEKQALLDFLDYVRERRAAHPGMHIYHYAAYERTALLRLAARHGVGEDEVDQLLRDGVLVDLYATVRRSLRIGRRSYSLKTLEKIYMGDHGRSGEVQTAASSIEEYALACAARDEGDLAEWDRRIAEIGTYNEYDCVSTLRLRDWLLGLVQGEGVDVDAADGAHLDVEGAGDDDTRAPQPPAPVVEELRARADDRTAADPDGVRTPDQQAIAMLAAAVDYHRREDKPFWWAHFDRLRSEPADWTDRRSTFLADPGTVTVVSPWQQPDGARRPRRRVRMVGRLEPGSELKEGVGVCALYEGTLPGCARTSSTGHRGWTTGTVVAVTAEGQGLATRDVLVVEEVLPKDATEHDCLPMALGPGFPPSTDGIARTIRAVAEDVAAALRQTDDVVLPRGPALDVLRRVPPRLRSEVRVDGTGGHVDDTAAITAALRALDGSYLAVQGPPGTGKTYTGAHVVAALVAEGWRVGVVAQSHAVVEHMLEAVIDAGVDPERVGKRLPDRVTHAGRWTALRSPASFRAFHDTPPGAGSVMGGTTWDLVNPDRLPPEPFDLVVVDEAGQFSLANTIAVAAAGRNLLLLGDPQQLPQVSQGAHPEPVDRSALGWLVDGHETLPPELGYFLARTWRMHPALADVVSRLSYEDRLHAMPHTAERSLDGVPPGVRCVFVEHDGNAVASEEEAAAVVAQVRDVVGRRWRDPRAGEDRPLTDADVIVVAAYNAQVWTVRRALDAAGLTGTSVGTVDKFQGRQAPVAIMTTAASSPDDVPRGMEFLLNRNRLNVALSRGQWCAVVVRSTRITDHLPRHPDRLAELGAFMGVCG